MNVIHSVPSLGESGGGPPRSVSQLCNELCQSNAMQVGLVTAVDPSEPIVRLDPAVRLTGLAGKGDSFRGRLQAADFGGALAGIQRDSSISVIHQHGIWLRSSHATSSYAYKNSVPLIVAPRGMLEPWALNHSKWKKKAAWMLFQQSDLSRADAFHATAHSEAESIRRLGFKQPIAVIPNGVELADPSKLTGVRSRSSDQRKTALFLSRINPKKGIPMLLDAWKALSPDGWRLVIAGNDDSSHLPALEQKIRELDLSNSVEFVGPLFGEEKERAFLDAALFLLPSYSENFGIVVAEALGYQVPVLTTTGCPWQELETHQCGWWVEPTFEGVQSGLKRALAASSGDRQLMGERGRRLVEDNYQWPGIAARICEFYKWLIFGGSQPDFIV